MKDPAASQYASVEQVKALESEGPWQTKSGGQLDVLFQLPFDFIQQQYFGYAEADLHELPKDIRGLRAYSVKDLKKNNEGAGEWHKLRSELVFALNGSVQWLCEDMHGAVRTVVLEEGAGVYTPPYILHTYKVLRDGTRLLVISSTLFDATDPTTQDSYSAEDFRQLQDRHLESNG